MGGTSLEQVKFNGAYLAADLVANRIFKNLACAGKLRMAEHIESLGAADRLADEGPVLVVNALADSNHDDVILFKFCPQVGEEFLDGERTLLKVDEVRHVRVRQVSQNGSGSKPACMSAHHLDDDDALGVIYAHLLLKFCKYSSDVLGCGSESRTVIDAHQVVIDRLRTSHDLDIINAVVRTIFGKLGNRIHGIVAADINKITDVMLMEYLNDLSVLAVVLSDIVQLETAGTESRCRRHAQLVQLFLRIYELTEIDEFLLKDALNPIARSDDLIDLLVHSGFSDCTCQRSVNCGCGAAGLGDQ